MLESHSSASPTDGRVVLCQFVPIAKQSPSRPERPRQLCSLPGQPVPLALPREPGPAASAREP